MRLLHSLLSSGFTPTHPNPFLCTADDESLLLIILDDLRRTNFRFVRIKPDDAKGTSLAQEVPALIQFDLDLREPLTISSGVQIGRAHV